MYICISTWDTYHVQVAIAADLPETLDAHEHVARASLAPPRRPAPRAATHYPRAPVDVQSSY